MAHCWRLWLAAGGLPGSRAHCWRLGLTLEAGAHSQRLGLAAGGLPAIGLAAGDFLVLVVMLWSL